MDFSIPMMNPWEDFSYLPIQVHVVGGFSMGFSRIVGI